MVILPLLILTVAVNAAQPTGPDPSAIETLLVETAKQLSAPLEEQGKGYSYYTYGTDELLYAVGDLDGDGVPEIAARAVYFMGVSALTISWTSLPIAAKATSAWTS
jgi:hypothetical protein